jgi:hypothetical protein
MSNEKQKTMATKTKILYRVDFYNEGSGITQIWAKSKNGSLSCAGIGELIKSNTQGKYFQITSFRVPYYWYKKISFRNDRIDSLSFKKDICLISTLWECSEILETIQFLAH